MDIQILGAHNCESQNSRCVSLLVDDVIAIDAGSITSSLSFPSQRKLKAVLITHHHYDHMRDIPAIAMNMALQNAHINVYSTPQVHDALATHLLNGKLYPDFFERPEGNPAVRFTELAPHRTQEIEGYSVLPVPVNHSGSAVGYQIMSPDGKTIFYTGDTGGGLSECWAHISPQMLIIEATASNRWEEFMRNANHLTPGLLEGELTAFRKLKGYLPRVVTVHMNPFMEQEIEAEIAATAKALKHPISMAHEGMRLQL